MDKKIIAASHSLLVFFGLKKEPRPPAEELLNDLRKVHFDIPHQVYETYQNFFVYGQGAANRLGREKLARKKLKEQRDNDDPINRKDIKKFLAENSIQTSELKAFMDKEPVNDDEMKDFIIQEISKHIIQSDIQKMLILMHQMGNKIFIGRTLEEHQERDEGKLQYAFFLFLGSAQYSYQRKIFEDAITRFKETIEKLEKGKSKTDLDKDKEVLDAAIEIVKKNKESFEEKFIKYEAKIEDLEKAVNSTQIALKEAQESVKHQGAKKIIKAILDAIIGPLVKIPYRFFNDDKILAAGLTKTWLAERSAERTIRLAGDKTKFFIRDKVQRTQYDNPLDAAGLPSQRSKRYSVPMAFY